MTKELSTSPERNSFHLQCAIERAKEDGRDPDTDADIQQEINLFKTLTEQQAEQEKDPEWQKDNLEFDLRSCSWMIEKVRSREEYAQNLYAAMCNNDFVKNEVWPVLKDQRWHCSWRYAGGIVAHMRQKGDYIDWYCSGIRGGATEEELASATEEQRTQYYWCQENFVSESVVTDEIREDLLKLGWIVVDEDEE